MGRADPGCRPGYAPCRRVSGPGNFNPACHSTQRYPVPRLTVDQLRDPLIEGAFKAARNRGLGSVSRRSLFTDPAHRRVFRQMLDEIAADPETEEVGRAAAALLAELGPDGEEAA